MNDIPTGKSLSINQEMSRTPAGEATLDHKDRSTGLAIFGGLTILLGCVVAGLAPVTLILQRQMAATGHGATPPFPIPISEICGNGLVAAGLVWLGVGSIMGRRWARALSLVCAWVWMFESARMLATEILRLAGSQKLQAAPVQFALLAPAMVFIILASVWILFYHRRDVRMTCEARDPVVRWTDQCPLPVLAACFWLVSSVPYELCGLLKAHAVFSAFGVPLSGASAGVCNVAKAGLWVCAAWALYRLDMRAWWFALFAVCLFAASHFVGLARYNPAQIHHASSPAAAARLHTDTRWIAMTSDLLLFGAAAGYLVSIRRYFQRAI